MKKLLTKSIIAAVVIEIIGAVVNLISYKANGSFLLAKQLYGGEWMGWLGFGMLLNRTFPMSSQDHPVSGSTWISFDPGSLLLTLLAGFAISFIVFGALHLIRKTDEMTSSRKHPHDDYGTDNPRGDMHMDTERAKALFIELRDHLRKQNGGDLDIQTGNAAKAVQYLEAASSEEEKEEIIKTYFRVLYPGGRGGLSDVVLWDEDYDTRVALNEPIDRIRKELWEICHR